MEGDLGWEKDRQRVWNVPESRNLRADQKFNIRIMVHSLPLRLNGWDDTNVLCALENGLGETAPCSSPSWRPQGSHVSSRTTFPKYSTSMSAKTSGHGGFATEFPGPCMP